jgi:hypothetical protein
MPYKSVYVEKGESRFLRESGFEVFPALCPRWEVVGSDIYGSSPAMATIGDVKQLQYMQTRLSNIIDAESRPALQVPLSLKNTTIDMYPGAINYIDQTINNGGIRRLFESHANIEHVMRLIDDVRQRIREGMFADLILLLTGDDTPQMTATEVQERREEKLMVLGPVLERLQNEILRPLVEITFQYLVRTNLLPAPPQELQGIPLNVEYISMVAMAQRAVGTNAIDRFVSHLGAVASIKPEIIDKLAGDELADAYADMLGVPPEIIVPGEKVALIRQQRAEQQAAMQQAAMLKQEADAAAKLGGIDTSRPNALTDMAQVM